MGLASFLNPFLYVIGFNELVYFMSFPFRGHMCLLPFKMYVPVYTL